jgi:hypothetical protein
MTSIGRATLCLGLLGAGVAAHAALENAARIERPALRRPLANLPRELGGWVGHDLAVSDDVFVVSQATECVSRVYENPEFPGVPLTLWVNYSFDGGNMRHSPETCLPTHGATKIEAMTKVLQISRPDGQPLNLTRLGYSQGEMIQGIGFWYYIFGEGKVERWVRGLPITSRSSHGRTTRGSGLTVEVFWRNETDPEAVAFRHFAQALLAELEPILPLDRVEYYVP